MHCEEVLNLLDRSLEEGLDLRQAEELHEHLAICESCRADHDRQRALLDILEGETKYSAPPGFAQGVMDRIRVSARPREGFFPHAVQLAFAILVVVAFGVASLILLPMPLDGVFDRNFLLPLARVQSVVSFVRELLSLSSNGVAASALLLAVLVLANVILGWHATIWDRGGRHGR